MTEREKAEIQYVEAFAKGFTRGANEAVRDCIRVAQKAYKNAPEGYSDNEAFEVAINALRSLLDKQDNIR